MGLLHERRDSTRRLYRTRSEGFREVQAFFAELAVEATLDPRP